jgi:hypothetical protein
MALSKETILQATNKGMAVFRHYIPFPFQVGRNFLNPLYKDKHASCNVFFDWRNDCYRLKDFGNDDYSGDCFAFVGKLCGLDCNRPADFIQILEKIDNDLHLGLADGKDYKPLTIASASSKHTPVIPSIQKPTSMPLKKGRPYNIIQKNFTQHRLIAGSCRPLRVLFIRCWPFLFFNLSSNINQIINLQTYPNKMCLNQGRCCVGGFNFFRVGLLKPIQLH